MTITTATRGTSTFARIEHAIVDLVLAGEFPQRNYTCDLGDGIEDTGDKYKTVVDYTTCQAPGELLLAQSKKTLRKSKCVANGPFSTVVDEQKVMATATWPCMIDTSYFEESSPTVTIPAEGIQPALVIRLISSDVIHPPRKNPETGSRAQFTFGVTYLTP